MDKKINKIRIKPRFKVISDFEKEYFENKLKEYILKNNTIFHGNINKEVANFSKNPS